jgi:hypothetical protein
MLDSADPDRGYALRWCEQAREMYKADGNTEEARDLLRDALTCTRVVDYASIYRSWIAMELDDGNVPAARDLYLEWERRRLYAGEDTGVGFWCMYINFEVKNGTAKSARAVAKAAVKACPSDPTVYAKNLMVKLLFGRGRRARRLRRHLDNFAMDVDCKDWLVHYQVGACHDDDDSKDKQLAGGFLLGRMCRSVRRLVQPYGYEPLRASAIWIDH